MWPLRHVGPPRGMEPGEAFTYALTMLAAWMTWRAVFGTYGHDWALWFDKFRAAQY
jgi:hypothetical protein